MLKIGRYRSSEFASKDQQTFSSVKCHGWPRRPCRNLKWEDAVHCPCTVKWTNSSQYI